jgi:predicted RNA-binding Zn-ribbon protein involved in translation (DUF1610 family)
MDAKKKMKVIGVMGDEPVLDHYEIECPYCGEELIEEWQSFCDADDNEAEGLVGYKCPDDDCGARFRVNGEEI